MQPGPIIGIVFALFAILVGNVLEGGHLGSIVGGPAALIVIGGTIGAVMVQYPMSTLLEAVRAAGRTFKKTIARRRQTDRRDRRLREPSAQRTAFSRSKRSLPALRTRSSPRL